jgi:hypothetical protein
MGEALLLLQRPSDAITELGTAWQLLPGNPPIGTRLIWALIGEGRLDEGVACFRDLLSRNEDLKTRYAHLTPILMESGNSGDSL